MRLCRFRLNGAVVTYLLLHFPIQVKLDFGLNPQASKPSPLDEIFHENGSKDYMLRLNKGKKCINLPLY